MTHNPHYLRSRPMAYRQTGQSTWQYGHIYAGPRCFQRAYTPLVILVSRSCGAVVQIGVWRLRAWCCLAAVKARRAAAAGMSRIAQMEQTTSRHAASWRRAVPYAMIAVGQRPGSIHAVREWSPIAVLRKPGTCGNRAEGPASGMRSKHAHLTTTMLPSTPCTTVRALLHLQPTNAHREGAAATVATAMKKASSDAIDDDALHSQRSTFWIEQGLS